MSSLKDIQCDYEKEIKTIKTRAKKYLNDSDLIDIFYNSISTNGNITKTLDRSDIKLNIDGESYKVKLEKE